MYELKSISKYWWRKILGQLFSEHNLNMRMITYRSEEYEVVAYTMSAGSVTKL
jgi:hypothetical protein